MALIYIDSCGDHYDTAHIFSKWDFTNQSGISIVAGRTGNGIKIPSGGLGVTMIKNLSADYNGLVMGCAFKMATLPAGSIALMSFVDTTTCQTSLCLDNAGRLFVTRGSSATSAGFSTPASATPVPGANSSPGLIAANQYYYVEMKTSFATGTTGSVTVRLGNTQVINATNQITSGTGNSTANQIALWAPYPSPSDVIFDDIYLASISGGGVTDFLGDCKVGCLFPTSDYAVSMTPSVGTSHYVLVNEVSPPDGDTSYNSSATPTNFDLYELQDLPETVVTVRGVQSCMYARKDDGSARMAAPRFSNGTASTNGTTISLPDTYGYRLQAFDSSPVDASDLTGPKVNALKGGIYVVS